MVNKIFTDYLSNTIEVYIDDMLIKSLHADHHLDHLRQEFDVLERYNMKLNPVKCSFGLASGKLLGFLVTQHGIEANLNQIQYVMNIPSLTYIRDVQCLAGRVASLFHFISHSFEK